MPRDCWIIAGFDIIYIIAGLDSIYLIWGF